MVAPASFHEKIKFIREREAGLTQKQVAEKLGLHPNYYARIERGEIEVVPRRRTAIAHALGVPVARLDEEPEGGSTMAIEQRAVADSADFARQSPRVQRWFRGLVVGRPMSIGDWFDLLRVGETCEAKGVPLPGEAAPTVTHTIEPRPPAVKPRRKAARR